MNLAEELSAYCSSIEYKDLTEKTVVETKKRLLDTIGCAIAAFNAEPARLARRIAERVTAKHSATLWGTNNKTELSLASFVNSIMVRYFDYNDTYLSKEPAHPSDNIASCIAAAEASNANGKELITAIAIAYEIQCRLADAANLRHKGWDHVCYGLASVALSAGKLLGLDSDKLTQALNISLASHITMRQVRAGELSMWKGCSFAESARNAVFSVLLAKEGFTGPSPIFEGEMGFWKQVSGPFKLDVEEFGGRKGRFKIEETSIKYFPAEYHAQSAIWAALAVREKISNPSEIEKVEVATHEAGLTILARDPEKWNPKTRETADHSLPYIVSRALLDGKVDNDSYSEERIKEKKIIDFMKKVKVVEDKRLTAMYPEKIANRVTVYLKSGKKFSEQVDQPRGSAGNPMNRKEIEEKFEGLTKDLLTRERRRTLIEKIFELEKIEALDELLSLINLFD